ncbi:hypothetical protein [Leptospira sp. GIMC2001]|uniref:hypothetical protein n=1 Tax=Leptospira sp. GIMC2001 TaxID=1513297 RepID=UPI00234AB124|nr:hypothetical protein [Leptospira sp. GIMC2001]WCL48415.1 hypothetical protein O4O04_14035 [Leptospira sp. GIMC2001]
MSLCQPNGCNISCGSCCGFFNLDLSREQYKTLLFERTTYFESHVDFNIAHTIPAYRQAREKIENQFPKKDESTYNCPFLGYLDIQTQTKFGCMIHPARTGDPKSQNYSFYGSSICLGYECKNMENSSSANWEGLFTIVAKDSIEYSQLAANYILIRKIESFFNLRKIPTIEIFTKYKDLTIEFLRNSLSDQKNLTSFEVDYDNYESEEDVIQWLIDHKIIVNLENALDRMK